MGIAQSLAPFRELPDDILPSIRDFISWPDDFGSLQIGHMKLGRKHVAWVRAQSSVQDRQCDLCVRPGRRELGVVNAADRCRCLSRAA